MHKADNLHNGHRSRLRNKFLKYGADGLEKHEILELYIAYAIPRKNTNDIAHALIDKFGSISDIFDADIKSITNVKGIGPQSAILIKLLNQICRICKEECQQSNNKVMSIDKIPNYINNKYTGRCNEAVSLMLLSHKMKILFFDIISEGSFNCSNIYTRDMVEKSIKYNAKYAIMAHNHPSGNALPSSDDIDTTKRIYGILDFIDVTLLEHYIVSGNECTPFIHIVL